MEIETSICNRSQKFNTLMFLSVIVSKDVLKITLVALRGTGLLGGNNSAINVSAYIVGSVLLKKERVFPFGAFSVLLEPISF